MVLNDVTRDANRQRLAYGSVPIQELLSALDTTPAGLTSAAAADRAAARGGRAEPEARLSLALKLFTSQFRSSITLILIAAAILSIFLLDVTDAAIILTIVLVGAVLGFWQEFSASNALAALVSRIAARATVLRDDQQVELPTEKIVPGDVLLLTAGSMIPADCRLLESQDLFVNESALTGDPRLPGHCSRIPGARQRPRDARRRSRLDIRRDARPP